MEQLVSVSKNAQNLRKIFVEKGEKNLDVFLFFCYNLHLRGLRPRGCFTRSGGFSRRVNHDRKGGTQCQPLTSW